MKPLTVAWFSYFPVEWLPNLPEELRSLPKQHPATWQRVLWEEFRSRTDLNLHIFSLRKEYPRSFSFTRDNTTFHCLKTPGGLRAPSLYWTDTLLLRRELRRLTPDLCHAWGSEFGSAIVASRLPYPYLVTVQGIMEWLKTVFPLNRQQQISAALEKSALRRARVATAESSFAINFLHQRYPKLKLLQVEHAPNPVFLQVRRKPQTEPLRFVCVSRFVYDKGPDVLLDALQNLGCPRFELIWIGSVDAAIREQLKSRIRPELWDCIQFRQDLTPPEIADEFARATMLLYPTRADNSPNAVKEAAVAGVPVVASRVGGIPDYISEGRNGLLFEVGDAKACQEAIQRALNHPTISRGLVEPGKLKEVREYLSPEHMADSFRAAYDSVLEAYSD